LAGLTFLYYEGNYFLIKLSVVELLLADEAGDLDLASKQNFNALGLSNLLSVPEELLHAVVVVGL
jgi:hypothetical protein